jgi:uncharacterized protein YlxW (UPF0749 family)
MEGFILEHVSERQIDDFRTLQELLCKNNIKELRIIRNLESCDYSIKFKAEIKSLEDKEASSLRYQNKKVNEQILYYKQDLNKSYLKNTKLKKEIEDYEMLVKRLKQEKESMKKTIENQKSKIDEQKKVIHYMEELKKAGY